MYLPQATREQTGFSSAVATVVKSKALGPVHLVHTKAPLAGDDPFAGYTDPGDALVWAFITDGAIVCKRAYNDLENRAGHMNMNHMPRLSGFQMTPDFRALSIRMDRQALGLSSSDIDSIARTVFPLTEGLPLMIGSLASQTMRMSGDLGPASGAALAHSILELTTAFVDDFLGRRSAPETMRSNLVTEARQYVDLYSSSPALSAASVAAALQVSPRTLQKAFEPEEDTLGRLILESRLARARALMERDRGGLFPIGDIGVRSGFASPSAFSRAFRARYGLAPREWRERYLQSIAE
ncbi:helix-turn-helix domain-containing protein [Leifsonia flava]|uniref:AraC family transcriptional regulator n=1 Tax=Orlajensenia leifsoniae TaxID=2561933 RepID=A0A4Y9R667_9MICO|nr:helix-turn-helix domain-containing protein [Leifsonia flava]TFV99830.1 AraC family transcriptional regulator [Leifsonia flava]